MNNQKIQILPALQIIIDKVKASKELDFENITFVCVQHLLFTTVDLIRALITLGTKPSNIHITGKIYSTCPGVVEQIIEIGAIYYRSTQPQQLGCFNEYFNQDIVDMWDKIGSSLRNTKSDIIIILDDGSKSIANIPKFLTEHYTVFAVEQTSSGIAQIKKNNITIPVVNVAFSAAKQLLESPMIARAVVEKLGKFLSLHTGRLNCGVAGLGVIGRAVVQKLLSLNHQVVVYDRFEEKYDLIDSVKVVGSVRSLFQEADYIFGCTGEDITISLDFNEIRGIKNLISCSSQDVEFLSLLKFIQTNFPGNYSNILSNMDFTLNNGIIKFFRGGYPINLDNSGESVPAKDIQLTRGLLLGGIIQALFHLLQGPKPEAKQYMLHPKMQKLIVQEIRTDLAFNEKLISNFLNEEWVKNNSSGEYMTSDTILKYFTI